MRYLAVAALLALAVGAAADMLLWDNGDFDAHSAASNGRGTGTYFGRVNIQVADDLWVEEPGWSVTGVHFEGLCFFGNLQVDYLIVEFFMDSGNGLPQDEPFYSEESYNVSVDDYYDPDWGYYHVDIDADFGPVLLDPGYCWIVTQPYGLWGDWFFQGCTTQQWGEYFATRDLWWYQEEWKHIYPYDVNFKMYGEVVPEPGAITALAGVLLGIGGIVRRRK